MKKTLNESNDNVRHLSHYLPEVDAGFLKWYSKYFGTNVPKPIIPNRRNIVDRELNTKTCKIMKTVGPLDMIKGNIIINIVSTAPYFRHFFWFGTLFLASLFPHSKVSFRNSSVRFGLSACNK